MASEAFDYRGAREAIASSDLAPMQRLVLWQLVEHMPNCAPSVERLAQRTGCSRRTVITHLAELEHAGWLRTTRRFGARSEYLVTIPNQCSSCTGESPAPVQMTTETGANPAQTSAAPAPKAVLSRKKQIGAATSAAPAPHSRPVFHSLDGFVIDEELFTEAELDYQIPRDRLRLRVAKLGNSPIGGAAGVFSQREYVRSMLRSWKLWGEQERAKPTKSGATFAKAKAPGLTGAAARKALEDFK